MKRLELIKVNHNIKIGDICNAYEPNITEDTVFTENDVPIGFFLTQIDGKLKQYIDIADKEFRGSNVPKQEMSRGPQGSKKDKIARAKAGVNLVTQYSTILGSVPPKPHMRRNYATRSSVHNVKSARTFVKAMILACREAEQIVKQLTPNIYEQQLKLIEEYVPKKWRFGNMFTSSISNYNISAPFHRDTANIKGCVNVILTKKQGAKGGNLHVPDYNATMDSADNSLLVYPAWKNVHGVTPIEAIPGGYRNSFVFYPLASFKNY